MSTSSSVVAVLVSIGIATSACASSDGEPAVSSPEASSSVASTETPNTAETPNTTETPETPETPDAARSDAGVRRELALDVRPESDVATNPLPSVVLDDVGQDRQVDFRNIFPAERPVLLWMWAPY